MIGVLGGTFDPVHHGHLRPAQEVAQALGLETLRFIPSARPPHRPLPVAPFEHRLEMLRLALMDCPVCMTDDREYHRPGTSYSVDTLDSLRGELGQTPICFLLGTDAFTSLPEWHEWQRIPDQAHLIVMQRPGSELVEMPDWARDRLLDDPGQLRLRPAGLVYLQAVTPVNISATAIREAIAAGQPVTGLLPPLVQEYIEAHGLYR